jgi:hypothetical protein
MKVLAHIQRSLLGLIFVATGLIGGLLKVIVHRPG